MTVRNSDTQFCVVSSAGENLGCFLDRPAAEARLQETGQERLLQVIGETARLEQREVLGVLQPTDPAYASTPLTCGTPAEQATKECSFEQLKGENVVFKGRDDDTKYQLGPVEITGDAIDKASAVYNAGSSTSVGQGWEIRFDLTGDGAGSRNIDVPLAIDPVAQRLACDVGHHIVEERLDVSGVVERENVRMLQAGEEPDLANEAKFPRLGCGIGVQNLERNLSLVFEILRQVHCSERALSDFTENVVVSAQRFAKRCDRIVWGSEFGRIHHYGATWRLGRLQHSTGSRNLANIGT